MILQLESSVNKLSSAGQSGSEWQVRFGGGIPVWGRQSLSCVKESPILIQFMPRIRMNVRETLCAF